jgi:hypothetical protein
MLVHKETPRQTLDYYALCVSGVMHKPLDLVQRAAIVDHLERVLPPLALKEFRSDWAMGLALAVTQEVLADPRQLAAVRQRVIQPAAAQPS